MVLTISSPRTVLVWGRAYYTFSLHERILAFKPQSIEGQKDVLYFKEEITYGLINDISF